MQSLYQGVVELVTALANAIINFLPTSPFRAFIDSWALDQSMQQYLGWLNWFFPVRGALTIVAAWLAAYTVFLLYSIVMRWVKMIGD